MLHLIIPEKIHYLICRDFLKKTSDCMSVCPSLLGSEVDLFNASFLSFLNENERDQNSENIVVLVRCFEG